MCNFRQKALDIGARIGVFVPRSTYKSTVCTHGGAAWELLRDPNRRIGIFSSIFDRAHDFFVQAQRVFDSNELVAWLYPEYMPTKGDGNRWNDREMVLPNRSKTFPEPNLKPFTAGGSTQGVHVDEAIMDDIVGDAQLNADHGGTADMYRLRNWMSSSQRTLLISMVESSIVVPATRYGMDDPYEPMMLDCKEHFGHWDNIAQHYPELSNGEWSIYYRQAIEEGQSIFPDAYTVESLARLAEADSWTYQTQYMNNPINSSSVEFAGYTVPQFQLNHDSDKGWTIIINNQQEEIPLASCDIVMAIDPAGSEKYVSIRTSRSCVVLLARDTKDRKFLLRVQAGFVPTTL
jgi:hypothetical protein